MSRLSQAHKDVIKELYEEVQLTVDDLPYTDEFETMYATFVARTCRDITKHDFWRALSGLRKASGLPRKER